MQIQSPGNLATTYGIHLQSAITRQAVPANGATPASTADSVSISSAARQALAAEAAVSPKAGDADGAVEARLAEIRARGAVMPCTVMPGANSVAWVMKKKRATLRSQSPQW